MYIFSYIVTHQTMRIRKRFPSPSFTSDLRLSPSATAPPQSDPPQQPSHKITPWGCPHPQIYNNEEKVELIKEFGDDETWKEEEKKNRGNDVRKITVSYEQERTNITIMHPSSSSADHQEVGWCEGDDYKLVVPLKKREGSFERNPTEETTSSEMKSNTRVEIHINEVDKKICQDCNNAGGAKTSKRKKVMVEGSHCSRVNGRGWRCCQPTLVGYALCEHHLGKGRLRSMGSVGCREVGGGHPQLMMISRKKRRNKARSISSLLSQV